MFLTLLFILGLVLLCTVRPALASAKPREFLVDYPTIEQRLPLKAGVTVYDGSFVEWTGGAIDVLSGAGVFAGVCRESAVGGAADGDVQVLVRTRGGIRVALGGGDTNSASIVGVASTVPEATDDDTVRVETGSAITGTLMGTFAAVILPIAGGGKVDICFKGGHVV